MKQQVVKMVKKMTGCDMFGIPVSVSFEGSSNYKTKLGSTCSIVLIVCMLINLITLSIDFKDGK